MVVITATVEEEVEVTGTASVVVGCAVVGEDGAGNTVAELPAVNATVLPAVKPSGRVTPCSVAHVAGSTPCKRY